MKAEIKLKKSKVFEGQKDVITLLSLSQKEKKDKTDSKKVKKNISFVIDASSSMNERINNNEYDGRNINVHASNKINKQQLISPSSHVTPGLNKIQDLKGFIGGIMGKNVLERELNTRFSLVVRATKQAIMSLNEDDYASITLFSSFTNVVCPAEKMTLENKTKFIQILNTLTCNGMTDLHNGWLAGVAEINKNLDSEYINRVILLTDGVTNQGQTNNDIICGHVLGAYQHGVSTSTIGVGNDFNEKLLQGMASSGAGNSYYIDKKEDVDKTFNIEFKGISNIVASEIQACIKTSGQIKLVKNLNLYKEISEGCFNLPALAQNEINGLFTFEMDKNINQEADNPIIYITLKYKDSNGKNRVKKLKEIIEISTKEEVDSLPENEEVKLHEMLNEIAEAKIKAEQAYRAGDMKLAVNSLTRSASIASNYASLASPNAAKIINKELNKLNSLSQNANSGGGEAFAKNLSFQAYQTKNAQDDDIDSDLSGL